MVVARSFPFLPLLRHYALLEHPIVVAFSGTLTFEDGDDGITLSLPVAFEGHRLVVMSSNVTVSNLWNGDKNNLEKHNSEQSNEAGQGTEDSNYSEPSNQCNVQPDPTVLPDNELSQTSDN